LISFQYKEKYSCLQISVWHIHAESFFIWFENLFFGFKLCDENLILFNINELVTYIYIGLENFILFNINEMKT
jgi:hypothetical protein